MKGLITTVLVLGAALAFPAPRGTSSLSSLALQKVLSDASPIFGPYAKSRLSTASWMHHYPDSTKLVHMNLPGVHDAQTWNYSQATQDALKHVTDLDGNTVYPPEIYRCQEKSIIDMLNAGIRVFDVRYAYDPTNSTLVFWHSAALMSETATVEDVLFGFYRWLDEQPSETLMLSFQYEGGTTINAKNDAATQMELFRTLTTPAAKKYFLQTKDRLGTLGEARGKITLLKRFDLDRLPTSYGDALPGIHFSPALWTDNGVDIALTYNSAKHLTAYIEDYYQPIAPIGMGAAYNIELKLNATTQHLVKASEMYPDSLFWSFASSNYDVDSPPETPRIMALGNGAELTPKGGVNQQLVPFLKGMKGKRVGIVMFDFFDTPEDLVQALLDP
jgi:1-phosphatidylinositol phosphodiesterase